MAEQIIDVGTAPNNGTGDPLRTAFIKTDNNFDQIWAAGPVGTNVRIQNNVISTLQVNQDLALSPNGVGNVRLNNNTIPGANNTWFLGSTTNRWRGLFVGNVTAGNVSTTNLNVPGDAYIGGNLTVVGNTIQIGNITTDTKTIQLANTATTDGAADGAGVTVGANDDIATFLYDAGNNVWTTNIGLQVDGAVTGTSIAVSDATVYGNLAAINGNFTGNVTANYFFGNGSQLTGLNTNSISNGTSNVLIATANGNVAVTTAGAYTWTFSTTGNVTLPGGGILGNPYNDSNTAGLQAGPGGYAIINSDDQRQFVEVDNAGIYIGTDYPGNTRVWVYDTSGNLTLPDTSNVSINYANGQPYGVKAIISNTAPALGNGGIWWNSVDGRAYVKYANAFIDLSPSLVPDPTTYVGNVSFEDITVTNVGNIIPAGNNAYSLGSEAFQWKDLWVSNNTIYINSVPITLGAGNVLEVNGNAVLSNDSDTSISTTGNITANYFIGNGSQLTGLPASYNDSNVVTLLSDFGSNTIATTGNISAGNFVGSGSNVELIAQSEQWVFDTTGNLTLPTAGYLRVQTGIIGAGASPAPTLSGFSSIATTGAQGNISASGNLLAAGYANITGNINGSGATFSGNVTAGNLIGNGSQLTAVNSATVDILNTNGLTTVFYPTFVENRNTAQTVRADVDLSYRTDTNTLTAGRLTVTASGTAINAGSGDILTNQVTGTQFNFLNGLYTVNLNAGQATANYALRLPANAGTNGQTLTTDGTGNLSWSTPAGSYGNSNVATFLAAYGSNTISTSGNITAGNFIGNISITGNVTGTSANVSLVAGSYQWTFNNAGNLVLPGNTFAVNYANGTAVTLDTVYLLEAYASETYTLPGSFTEDVCRYSYISNTVNVPSAWFNTSTYTFTPLKAGYWDITAAYDVYRNTEATMVIKKNTTIVASAGSFNAVAQQITKIIYLNGSTDYIQIFNTGGAALSRSQYESRSWFQARWIGE